VPLASRRGWKHRLSPPFQNREGRATPRRLPPRARAASPPQEFERARGQQLRIFQRLWVAWPPIRAPGLKKPEPNKRGSPLRIDGQRRSRRRTPPRHVSRQRRTTGGAPFYPGGAEQKNGTGNPFCRCFGEFVDALLIRRLYSPATTPFNASRKTRALCHRDVHGTHGSKSQALPRSLAYAPHVPGVRGSHAPGIQSRLFKTNIIRRRSTGDADSLNKAEAGLPARANAEIASMRNQIVLS